MHLQSHLSHLSPTFPQVWIEPGDKPVYNLGFGGVFSPVSAPQYGGNVPHPHWWTSCGQLFPRGEHPNPAWGQLTAPMWTIASDSAGVHIEELTIPSSSTCPVDDTTLSHLGKRPSSPVSTGPTTTTTPITIDGIKNHKVMQQSSPHLPVPRPKGDAP